MVKKRSLKPPRNKTDSQISNDAEKSHGLVEVQKLRSTEPIGEIKKLGMNADPPIRWQQLKIIQVRPGERIYDLQFNTAKILEDATVSIKEKLRMEMSIRLQQIQKRVNVALSQVNMDEDNQTVGSNNREHILMERELEAEQKSRNTVLELIKQLELEASLRHSITEEISGWLAASKAEACTDIVTESAFTHQETQIEKTVKNINQAMVNTVDIIKKLKKIGNQLLLGTAQKKRKTKQTPPEVIDEVELSKESNLEQALSNISKCMEEAEKKRKVSAAIIWILAAKSQLKTVTSYILKKLRECSMPARVKAEFSMRNSAVSKEFERLRSHISRLEQEGIEKNKLMDDQRSQIEMFTKDLQNMTSKENARIKQLEILNSRKEDLMLEADVLKKVLNIFIRRSKSHQPNMHFDVMNMTDLRELEDYLEQIEADILTSEDKSVQVDIHRTKARDGLFEGKAAMKKNLLASLQSDNLHLKKILKDSIKDINKTKSHLSNIEYKMPTSESHVLRQATSMQVIPVEKKNQKEDGEKQSKGSQKSKYISLQMEDDIKKREKEAPKMTDNELADFQRQLVTRFSKYLPELSLRASSPIQESAQHIESLYHEALRQIESLLSTVCPPGTDDSLNQRILKQWSDVAQIEDQFGTTVQKALAVKVLEPNQIPVPEISDKPKLTAVKNSQKIALTQSHQSTSKDEREGLSSTQQVEMSFETVNHATAEDVMNFARKTQEDSKSGGSSKSWALHLRPSFLHAIHEPSERTSNESMTSSFRDAKYDVPAVQLFDEENNLVFTDITMKRRSLETRVNSPLNEEYYRDTSKPVPESSQVQAALVTLQFHQPGGSSQTDTNLWHLQDAESSRRKGKSDIASHALADYARALGKRHANSKDGSLPAEFTQSLHHADPAHKQVTNSCVKSTASESRLFAARLKLYNPLQSVSTRNYRPSGKVMPAAISISELAQIYNIHPSKVISVKSQSLASQLWQMSASECELLNTENLPEVSIQRMDYTSYEEKVTDELKRANQSLKTRTESMRFTFTDYNQEDSTAKVPASCYQPELTEKLITRNNVAFYYMKPTSQAICLQDLTNRFRHGQQSRVPVLYYKQPEDPAHYHQQPQNVANHEDCQKIAYHYQVPQNRVNCNQPHQGQSIFSQQPHELTQYHQQPENRIHCNHQPQNQGSYNQQPQNQVSYGHQPQNQVSYNQQPQNQVSYNQQPQSQVSNARPKFSQVSLNQPLSLGPHLEELQDQTYNHHQLQNQVGYDQQSQNQFSYHKQPQSPAHHLQENLNQVCFDHQPLDHEAPRGKVYFGRRHQSNYSEQPQMNQMNRPPNQESWTFVSEASSFLEAVKSTQAQISDGLDDLHSIGQHYVKSFKDYSNYFHQNDEPSLLQPSRNTIKDFVQKQWLIASPDNSGTCDLEMNNLAGDLVGDNYESLGQHIENVTCGLHVPKIKLEPMNLGLSSDDMKIRSRPPSYPNYFAQQQNIEWENVVDLNLLANRATKKVEKNDAPSALKYKASSLSKKVQQLYLGLLDRLHLMKTVAASDVPYFSHFLDSTSDQQIEDFDKIQLHGDLMQPVSAKGKLDTFLESMEEDINYLNSEHQKDVGLLVLENGKLQQENRSLERLTTKQKTEIDVYVGQLKALRRERKINQEYNKYDQRYVMLINEYDWMKSALNNVQVDLQNLYKDYASLANYKETIVNELHKKKVDLETTVDLHKRLVSELEEQIRLHSNPTIGQMLRTITDTEHSFNKEYVKASYKNKTVPHHLTKIRDALIGCQPEDFSGKRINDVFFKTYIDLADNPDHELKKSFKGNIKQVKDQHFEEGLKELRNRIDYQKKNVSRLLDDVAQSSPIELSPVAQRVKPSPYATKHRTGRVHQSLWLPPLNSEGFLVDGALKYNSLNEESGLDRKFEIQARRGPAVQEALLMAENRILQADMKSLTKLTERKGPRHQKHLRSFREYM